MKMKLELMTEGPFLAQTLCYRPYKIHFSAYLNLTFWAGKKKKKGGRRYRFS